MDGDRFDDLLRALDEVRSRRRVTRGLAGLALGGMIGFALPNAAETRHREGRRHNDGRRNKEPERDKEKTCDPCVKRRRNGQCGETLRDGSTCNDTGQCYQGTCIARPTCVRALGSCTGVTACCSQSCAPIVNQCFYSGINQPCFENKDCTPGQDLSCIAYRCR